MAEWFYRSDEDLIAIGERLKQTPCSHCQVVGALNWHGYLRGFDDSNPRRKTIRARRVFCSNRNARPGCGHTFSVWLADKIRRLSLSTAALWAFLQCAVANGIGAAIRASDGHLSERTWQRIWKRFDLGQSQDPHGPGGAAARRPICRPSTGQQRTSSPISGPPSPTPPVRSPPSNRRCKPSSCKPVPSFSSDPPLTHLGHTCAGPPSRAQGAAWRRLHRTPAAGHPCRSITELAAHFAAAGRIEIGGNRRQRKLSSLAARPFASIDLRPQGPDNGEPA